MLLCKWVTNCKQEPVMGSCCKGPQTINAVNVGSTRYLIGKKKFMKTIYRLQGWYYLKNVSRRFWLVIGTCHFGGEKYFKPFQQTGSWYLLSGSTSTIPQGAGRRRYIPWFNTKIHTWKIEKRIKRQLFFFESPSVEYRTVTDSGNPLQSTDGPDRHSTPDMVESQS